MDKTETATATTTETETATTTANAPAFYKWLVAGTWALCAMGAALCVARGDWFGIIPQGTAALWAGVAWFNQRTLAIAREHARRSDALVLQMLADRGLDVAATVAAVEARVREHLAGKRDGQG